MEITGRVINVLPKKSGTSTRTGNAWEALPIIFEYFRNDQQTFADRVMLETFDTNVIAAFEKHMIRDADGKPKTNDSGHILLDQAINCAVEIGHRIRIHEGRTFNDVRLMSFRVIRGQQPAANATGTVAQPPYQAQPLGGPQTPPYSPNPFPPQVDVQGNPITNQGAGVDDLPF